MASDEAKHASIGIDLNINGMAEFRKADEMTSQFVERMRGVNSTVNELRDKFSGLGSSVSRSFTKPLDSVRKLHNEINELSHTKVGRFSVATPSTRQVDSMHKLVTETRSLEHTNLGHVKGQFGDVNKATDEGSTKMKRYGSNVEGTTKKAHTMRDVLVGSFAGNAISNAFSDIVTGAENAVKSGMQLAEAGARINKQWQDIGLSKKGSDSMIKQIADIRGKSDFAGSAIDSMQKKFYTLTGSAKQARALTNEMSAFGAEAGKSGDEVAQIANTLGRSLGGKTVSAGFFNRAFGSMPELRKQVVEASGMTNKAFTSALKNSKITGTQLEGYMLKAAKGSGKAWKQFGDTTQGKIEALKGTWQNLTVAFAKPMVSGLSKALDDTEKKNGGLDKTKKSVKEISTNLGKATGKGVGDAISFIVKNQKALGKTGDALWRIVKELASGMWKPFQSIITAIGGSSGKAAKGMNGFADSLENISKHKKAITDIGTAITGIFAINGAKKGLSWTKDLASAGKNSLGKLIFKPKVEPKVDTKASEKELTLFGKALKGTGKGIGKALKWTAKVSYKGAIKALSGLRAAASLTARGFKALGRAIVANPFLAVAAAVAAIGIALVELYKHNKKFRKFVNGLASDAKKAVGKIGKDFAKMGRDIGKSVNSMRKDVAKRFGNLWSDAKRTSKSGIKTLERGQTVYNDFSKGRWKKLGRDTKKLNQSMWKTSKSIFKSGYDYLNDLTDGRLGKMLKIIKSSFSGIGKAWHNFWNGIDSWFGNIWKSIGKHAANGINDIIKVLNGGISGIDAVIHAFGGKSTAIGKIGSVHFANGTGVMSGPRRPINKPTMAVLNDGHDSPETHNREMVVHANGMGELIKGTNVRRILEPGAEVFNASETKAALGMEHFAKGTGAFGKLWNGAKSIGSKAVSAGKGAVKEIGNIASGAWKGAKNLLKRIQSIIKSPDAYLNGLIKKPTEQGTVQNDFASGLYGKMKGQAGTWWDELWRMADSKLNSGGGGDASGLLAAVEKYGHGKKYVWGAGGPSTFDCSGLVMYALKHAFGISYPHYSGSQYSKSQHISKGSARPGDLVFFGPGGNEHVGVYAGHGDYYSALNPHRSPNIGMSPVSTGPGAAHYARVSGLSRKTKKDKSKQKPSKGLDGLITRETGGMMKWIEKVLEPLTEDAGGGAGNPEGEGVKRWAPYVRKAAKAMGVNLPPDGVKKVLNTINHESGGNPTVWQHGYTDVNTGRDPARGLVQFIGSTFRHYAVKGHGNRANGYDQLLALFNDRNWYHDLMWNGGWAPSGGRRRKNGGHMYAGETSIINEDGWEAFKSDTSGTMIPHDKSVAMVAKHTAKSDKPVTIDARTTVKVEGNMDDKILGKVQKMLEKNNDDKVDKIRGVLGLDDEWGLNA